MAMWLCGYEAIVAIEAIGTIDRKRIATRYPFSLLFFDVEAFVDVGQMVEKTQLVHLGLRLVQV